MEFCLSFLFQSDDPGSSTFKPFDMVGGDGGSNGESADSIAFLVDFFSFSFLFQFAF